MKIQTSILLALLLLGGGLSLQAQCTEKTIQKRVDTLEKEGWKAAPGRDLLVMIRDCCDREEQDQFTSQGLSTHRLQQIAKMQAFELAKMEMQTILENEIRVDIDAEIEDSVNIKVKYENISIGQLKYIEPSLVMYKRLPDGQYEYSTTLFLSKP